MKPLVLLVYNEGKCEIDYSDQIISYVSFTIRHGLKWYPGISDNYGCKRFNYYQNCNNNNNNKNVRKFRGLLGAKL